MEDGLIIVSEHIEIHPSPNGGYWCVVRDGSIYGTYPDFDQARDLAEELAGKEEVR